MTIVKVNIRQQQVGNLFWALTSCGRVDKQITLRIAFHSVGKHVDQCLHNVLRNVGSALNTPERLQFSVDLAQRPDVDAGHVLLTEQVVQSAQNGVIGLYRAVLDPRGAAIADQAADGLQVKRGNSQFANWFLIMTKLELSLAVSVEVNEIR